MTTGQFSRPEIACISRTSVQTKNNDAAAAIAQPKAVLNCGRVQSRPAITARKNRLDPIAISWSRRDSSWTRNSCAAISSVPLLGASTRALLLAGVAAQVLQDGFALVRRERRQSGLSHPLLHQIYLDGPHRRGH